MPSAPFRLPPLAYASLPPAIDDETLHLHHGRHHAAYVEKLNAAVAERPSLSGLSLAALLARPRLHASVRNNAGQHHAHSCYWKSMVPGGSDPTPALAAAIVRDFGSMEGLKAKLADVSMAHFGTGWAWLVKAGNGRLAVGTTADGDTPLMPDAAIRGVPLLASDLWEHAWYLKYRNEKARYLEAFWTLIDWRSVAGRLAAC